MRGQFLRLVKNNTILYYTCIILIFMLAVILRYSSVDFSRELVQGSDEFVYHYSAENLVKYGTLTYDRSGEMFTGEQALQPTSVLSPGYPLYVATIYFIFGHSPKAVIVSQFILSILCLWFVYRILALLKLKRIFVAASLFLVAIYPSYIYSIERMLTEQLFTTLLLGFAYFFLWGFEKNSYWLLAVSSVFLTFATHVRALAFPFLIIAILFVVLYERRDKKNIWKKSVCLFGVFIILMLPWWIRNWATFNTFMLFSQAGDNPKVWGAVPYFIDMTSTNNQSLQEIIHSNISSNPWVYYKWRIFGFFQYMWGDLWDENLVHPQKILRPFLAIQQLFIVPIIACIPFLYRRGSKELFFISCIPIVYTLMNMPFHGLPRYVFPSSPFVFILFGVMIAIVVDKFRGNASIVPHGFLFIWQKKAELWIRKSYFTFTILFSVVLIYSVYVFAYSIPREMSEFRLGKYMDVSLSQLSLEKEISTRKFDISNITVENATPKQRTQVYENNVDAPVIIRLRDEPSNNSVQNNIVSEVTLNIQGGYLYDYMTVYWTGKNTAEVSESYVYKFPINIFQKSHKIYIDDDVTSLMIVPAVFRGGTFTFNSIIITKYQVGKSFS